MPEETPELPVSPPEAQTEPSSFFDKLKLHKFKILGGALLVLGFAGVIFVVYSLGQRQIRPGPQPTPTSVATPTPDLTANWNVSANTFLGISFKYPTDWEVKLVGSTVHLNPQGSFYSVVAYPIEEQDLRATKEAYVTNEIQTVTQSKKEHPEYDVTEYAMTLKEGVPGAGRSTVINIVEYKNRVFLWQLADLESKDIFDQILSTFKFLGEESCVDTDTGESMTLSAAREISQESECVEEGDLSETYSCNESTGTWWLDLDIKKEGCAPACVVDVSTKEAEINWRCTGFIPPEKFTCPPGGTLNCMPGPDRPELKYCTSEYSAWIQANCPRVQIVW